MQFAIIIVIGVFVYFFSEWVLKAIEANRGEPLKYRGPYFFGLMLGLTLVIFTVLDKTLNSGPIPPVN